MNELKILGDEFETTFQGEQIKGRVLNLFDLVALQDIFPDWDGDNVNELLATDEEGGDNKTRIHALVEIARIGLDITREQAQRLFNLRNLSNIDELNGIIRKILDSDDDSVIADGDEASKNG